MNNPSVIKSLGRPLIRRLLIAVDKKEPLPDGCPEHLYDGLVRLKSIFPTMFERLVDRARREMNDKEEATSDNRGSHSSISVKTDQSDREREAVSIEQEIDQTDEERSRR